MDIPKLKIGKLTARIPIIQGGMGVRVSMASLAAAVANEGGIGTIAAVGLGDLKATGKEFERKSREALIREIQKAKEMTSGLLAVNIMGALSNAQDLVKAAIQGGIGMIVFGAGLPLALPAMAEGADVALVPVVSSERVAKIILRSWDNRYGRTVDGFILEGPLAGGHLGFTPEQLDDPEHFSLETILPGVLKAVKPYEEKYGRKIPVVAAGGIYDGGDIERMLEMGAAGVQLGTRFVCTEECGVSAEFKQAYIDSKAEDISIIKSPVGMPGRALRNRFLAELEDGQRKSIRCGYHCLTACKVKEARFCIADALVNAYRGKLGEGLIFAGSNAYRIDKIVTVKALISELISGFQAAGQQFKSRLTLPGGN